MDNRAFEHLCICLGNSEEEEKKNKLLNLSFQEWKDMVEEAERQEVLPLLYHQIKKLEIALPRELMSKLERAFLHNALRNSLIIEKMKEIIKRFNEKGIKVVLLKGIYLLTIYENIGLRAMSDVDFLVKKEDLERAGKEMFSLGYRASGLNPLKGFPGGPHQEYCSPGEGLEFEVHWTLFNPRFIFRVDVEEMLKRAREIRLDDASAFTLAYEDILLYLATHLSAHITIGQVTLRLLCDINELIMRYWKVMDWEEILVRARKWKITRPLYLALWLSKELLGTNIPADILSSLKPIDFKEYYIKVAMDNLSRGKQTTYYFHPFLALLLHKKGIGPKISLLRQTLFPPRKIIASLYHISPSSPVIYLLYIVRLLDRFIKLAKDYSKLLWGLLRREKIAKKKLAHLSSTAQLYNWLLGD